MIVIVQLLIFEMNCMLIEYDKGEIDVKIDEVRFQGVFKVMVEGINNMVFGYIVVKKKVMVCIKEFGEGNMDVLFEVFFGKKVFINNIIEQMCVNVKVLIIDIWLLVVVVVEGKFDIWVDVGRY